MHAYCKSKSDLILNFRAFVDVMPIFSHFLQHDWLEFEILAIFCLIPMNIWQFLNHLTNHINSVNLRRRKIFEGGWQKRSMKDEIKCQLKMADSSGWGPATHIVSRWWARFVGSNPTVQKGIFLGKIVSFTCASTDARIAGKKTRSYFHSRGKCEPGSQCECSALVPGTSVQFWGA